MIRRSTRTTLQVYYFLQTYYVSYNRQIQKRSMKKKQRIFYKKIAILVIVVLLILVGRALVNGMQSLDAISEKREKQERLVQNKQVRVDRLEKELSYLQTQEGLEQEMIATLPIKRPGEQVVVLIEQEEKETRFLERKEEKKSWWKFWSR